jgi:hypothetical protein
MTPRGNPRQSTFLVDGDAAQYRRLLAAVHRCLPEWADLLTNDGFIPFRTYPLMKKPSILNPPFSARFNAAWFVLALTACLSIGSALAADQGARHHAKGEYDAATGTYEVVKGDELIKIGERFEVPLDTLKAENDLSSDVIKPGQKLTITTAAQTVSAPVSAQEQQPGLAANDPLASWNEGPAKQAIMAFVKETTTEGSPQFVPPAERIATFDQDGTLWVEHPMYSQVV